MLHTVTTSTTQKYLRKEPTRVLRQLHVISSIVQALALYREPCSPQVFYSTGLDKDVFVIISKSCTRTLFTGIQTNFRDRPSTDMSGPQCVHWDRLGMGLSNRGRNAFRCNLGARYLPKAPSPTLPGSLTRPKQEITCDHEKSSVGDSITLCFYHRRCHWF